MPLVWTLGCEIEKLTSPTLEDARVVTKSHSINRGLPLHYFLHLNFFLSPSINSADAISASFISLSFRDTRVGTGIQYCGKFEILALVVSCWNRIGMGSQYCGYLELALEAIFLGVFESDSYSARAELFYPGDGVVDSLLAPRGSTTKRLKESDLVVTQPVKIISLYAYTSFFLSPSINSADAISASFLSLSFCGTRVGTGIQYCGKFGILALVVSCWNRIGMGSQYCGYLELALEAIFLGVFESDSYSAVRYRITKSWSVLSWGRRG
ncbi:hypothetical protein Lal_00049434 [Lupinus albus]|nr:hypothetical protein Lal_00049434 [Lupinus albus]